MLTEPGSQTACQLLPRPERESDNRPFQRSVKETASHLGVLPGTYNPVSDIWVLQLPSLPLVWPQVLAITLRHMEEGTVSSCICVFMCMVFSFNFVSQKAHNLFCFAINVFLPYDKEHLGGYQRRSFCSRTRAKQSRVLTPTGYTVHSYAVCGIVSLVV